MPRASGYGNGTPNIENVVEKALNEVGECNDKLMIVKLGKPSFSDLVNKEQGCICDQKTFP